MSTVEERIEKFNDANKPFGLMDYEDGNYGLSLRVDFLGGLFEGYRQEGFDKYAISVGEPIKKGGLYTHGSGYDWERVFKKVFEQEKALEEIEFDSEAGGFYCSSERLEVLEELGQRFKTMCEDKEKFEQTVVEALTASRQEEVYHFNNRTIKYYLQDFPRSKFEIVTQNYHFVLTEDQGREMVRGKNIEVYEKNTDASVMVVTKTLFNFQVNKIECDWDNGRVFMKATLHDDSSLLMEKVEEMQVNQGMEMAQ